MRALLDHVTFEIALGLYKFALFLAMVSTPKHGPQHM